MLRTEAGAEKTIDEESKRLIDHLYKVNKTDFKTEDFIPIMEDPLLKQKAGNRELSPTTKLRILQRKLASQRQI